MSEPSDRQPGLELGHGLLGLAALWWAWAAYAWLTNTVDPGEALVWGTTVVAMAAMFVGALAPGTRRDASAARAGLCVLTGN